MAALRNKPPEDDLTLRPGAASYRPDIDGLRAIAVLCVIAFHAFPRRVPGGYVGVDVFFVISGFLISGIIFAGLRRGRFSYIEFYVRRIRRIFPALLVVLTSALLVGWFVLLPDDLKQLGKETAAGAAFASNLLFWSQAGYFDVNATEKPLLHLWSLGVEEQFYIAWPMLLVLLYRRSRHLPSIIAAMLIASFVINIMHVSQAPSSSFYLPTSRLWELLTGALLALPVLGASELPGTQRGWGSALASKPFWREALAWFGVALIGASLLLLDRESAFPGWWAWLPVGGTLCLIVARDSWLNRSVLSRRALVFIGLISYPLYLWHWVALTFLHLRFHDGAEVAPTSLRLAVIALSFILAWATYALLERPVRFGPHPVVGPVTLLLGMGVVGLCGLVMDVTDGGSWRYPMQMRPLTAFDYQRERERTETAYRADSCFLGKHQTFAELAVGCGHPPRGRGPLLALWGDSHAASLYPGLSALQQRRGDFRIAQFTASSCPPLLGQAFRHSPNCQAFNEATYARLVELKPELVVLMGNWPYYENSGELNLTGLRSAVTRLAAAGVRRVIVMGCLPEWTIAQPKVSLRLWKDTRTTVARTSRYLNPSLPRIDAAVEHSIVGSGAVFVSPLRALCDAQGCRLSVAGDPSVPIAWDVAHLTVPGSEYLIALTASEILGTTLGVQAGGG